LNVKLDSYAILDFIFIAKRNICFAIFTRFNFG